MTAFANRPGRCPGVEMGQVPRTDAADSYAAADARFDPSKLFAMFSKRFSAMPKFAASNGLNLLEMV